MEQYSEQSSKPSSQQSILKKAERRIYHRCVVSDRPSNLLKRLLLVTLPYMNDDIDIYTQRTTKLFTPIIIKSFVGCTESVNTKRENSMVYGANFTQCVCTGYCESWILSSLLLL